MVVKSFDLKRLKEVKIHGGSTLLPLNRGGIVAVKGYDTWVEN
jgi:hypothetical protein